MSVETADSVGVIKRAWLTLRSAVYWMWLISTTLVLGAPVLLLGWLRFEWGYFFAMMWLKASVYGLRVTCGVKWRVEGREHLPDGPCVMLAKHQSTWETFFLPTLRPGGVFVAKRSLLYVPVFGWAMYVLSFILIDRKSGRSAISQMVEQARDRLQLGRWVIVFPEGTRRPVGAEPDYRIGGAIMAVRTDAPVIPVAVNSGHYWPRLGFIKWPGTITVRIGPAIEVSGRKSDAVLADTREWIETQMVELDAAAALERRS